VTSIIYYRSFLSAQHFCLATIVLFCCSPSFAQDKLPGKPAKPPRPPGSAAVFTDEDYHIGPNDVIDIKVEDAPELSGTFQVNAKGFITLPVIGMIEVAKKTTDELIKAISGKLATGGYLTNPIVSILVKQRNTRTFFIQGAVHNPGMYQVEGRPTLLKLITIAGGLGDNYGSTAFIIRNKRQLETVKTAENGSTGAALPDTNSASEKAVSTMSENPEDYEIIRANINNILRGHLEQNLVIQPGDIVHIPKTDVFFVAGDVKAPGTFSLKEGTTLRQAIALAQGVTFDAAANQGIIFRENEGGARQEIKVNISAVMVGKSPDVDILPNDIIMVPNNQTKTTAKTLMTTVLPAVLLRVIGIL
jgi:polysaccharide biosynthesis/export protein